MGYTIWPDGATGDVVAEVYKERQRQEQLRLSGKFLWTCADPSQSNARALAVLSEEFGEAAREVVEEIIHADRGQPFSEDNLRKELIQIAAVAIAHVEAIDARARAKK